MAPTFEISEAPARVTTFEACYEAHREEVYRLGLRYGGGRAAFAEDVAHDVFVKVLEQGARLGGIEHLGAWLYRVTANLAISRLRREQSIVARLQRAFHGQDEAAEESPEVLFEQQETASAALAALRRLPARERVVVCMKVLDGKSQREIAETLGMSEGYVSKLLARARQRIEGPHTEADDVPVD